MKEHMVESVVQSPVEVVVDSNEKKLIRVLHVDDELNLLKVTKKCLEMVGPFQVDTANSVEKAMAKLEKEHYDAVVSDCQMPGKDGLQFLKELREKGNSIPFIVFTGKGSEEAAIEALNLGADEYFNKCGLAETIYGELAQGIQEIVDKRRAERSLLKSQDKYRRLVESLRGGIWVIDKDSYTTFVNPRMAEILGYDREEMKGRHLFSFMDGRGVEVARRLLEGWRQGVKEQHDLQFLKKDGTPVYATLETTPLTDDNGNYSGALASVMDITERKKTEESLRESEEKFRGIFEDATDFMALVDAAGRILDVNEKAAEVFGGSKGELVGKHFIRVCTDVMSPAQMRGVEKEFAAGLANRKSGLDLSIRNKKGQTILLECSASLLKLHDKSTCLSVVGRDVTERKRVEEELASSEAKFRSLIEQSLEGIVVAEGPVPHLVFANKALSRIYGYTPEELTSLSAQDTIGLVHPEDRDVFFGRFKDRLEGKRSPSHLEFRGIKKDGTVMWLETSLHRIEFNGHPAVEATFIDITKRKKGEKEIAWLASFPALHPSPVVELNSDGTVNYVNSAAESLFPDLKKAGLSHPFLSRWKDVVATFKHEKTRTCSRNVKIGDAWFNQQFSFVPETQQVRIYAIDVTDLKQVEEKLRESETKFRMYVENSPVAVFVADSEGKYEYVNEAASKLLGYSAKELQSISIPQVVFKEEHPNSNSFATLQEGTGKILEVQLNKKNGQVIYVNLNAVKLPDGKSIAFCQNITERKKMEEALRKSETKYRSLIEQSTLGTVIAQGPIARIVFANSAMSKILGYTVEEFTSLSHQQTVDLVHPDDRELFFRRFKDRLDGKPVPPRYEVRGIRKDGTVVWLELSSVRIEYDGQPAVQAIFTDITERKKAEDQKDRLAHDLNERVKELTCLYGLSKIITKYGNSIEKIMQDTVFLLPPAYQHPNIACARIVWKDRKYITGNFRETRWSQTGNIKVHGEIVGALTVCYLQDKPEADKELFLKEERNLLEAIAERLGRVIERIEERALRQNEERELQESQRKFEGLFTHNPEAAVYLDVNFKILDLNPHFCQLFGYSAEEVKGKNINDVVAPEDLHEEAESLDKDAKNGYASHNTVRKRKDGSLVPVSISAAPVTFENNLLGYIGIYKDITDLKRAQDESEESRKHFQMLFDLMATPVAVVDGKGKILEVTQKMEEATEFKKEEFVGKNLLKLEMFGAETRAVLIKKLAERMMGTHMEPYEVEVLKKDGGKLMYEINDARINYRGTPADLIVFRDILERKNLEEKLRVVGSLTRHDVANKLSVVTGNAYLLKRNLAKNHEALEQLANMENAVRSVETIFEFARTYEKLGVERLTNVDVGEAIDGAASLFPSLKGVRILNECGGLTVLADSLLRQLFYNLIDDSLKYGEKLTQIRIRYEKSKDNLKVVYEDDGAGISKDNKANIFNEGFTTGKGTGYGLFMIKRICDVYGWTIQEAGTRGKGVKFIMTITPKNP